MLRTPDKFLREGSKVFRPTPADKRIVRALLQAAQTKGKDVEVDAVSLDTRVEAAYDAVFDCCLAVLNAERYRTLAVPGHHQEALEAACALVGTGNRLFERLGLDETSNIPASRARKPTSPRPRRRCGNLPNWRWPG